MFMKSFIYWTIIAVIATFSSANIAQAKSYNKDNNLANMDFPPENFPEFESSITRHRRQTAPDESDVPKQLQKDSQLYRTKRQMPSPPGDIPMPPM